MTVKTIATVFALYLCSALAAAQNLPTPARGAPLDGTTDTRWSQGEARAGTTATTWRTTGDNPERRPQEVRPEQGIHKRNGAIAATWNSGPTQRTEDHWTRRAPSAETEVQAALREIGYERRDRARSLAQRTAGRRAREAKFDPNCHTCRIEAGWQSRVKAAAGRLTDSEGEDHREMGRSGQSQGPTEYGYGSRPAQQGHNCAGCQQRERSARRTSRYGW